MTESILELAAADACDALKVVRVAAGYATDAFVTRDHKEGDNPRDGLFLVTVGDPAPKPGAPLGFDEYLVPVLVACHCLPLNADPVPVATRLARMAADVRKALMLDPHRGGHAIYTQFTAKDEFNTSAAPYTVAVTAYLWVRTRMGNPYSDGG